MNSKTLVVSLFVPMLLAGLLISTSFVAAQEEPRYGGTLIAVYAEEVTSLGPFQSHSTSDLLNNNIYDSLLVFDGPTAEVVPQFAESWEMSEDGLTYTFNLRRNAKFHDGEPVTSADVKFSLLEVVLPYARGGHMLDVIDTIEIPDDYTVVIELKYRGAIDFLRMLADGRGMSRIAPKHLYEGTDILENPHNENPIGSGPFKFAEWVRGDHLTLDRNENYWKEGRPYLDRIVYKFVKDYATLVAAIEAGEADVQTAYFGCELKTLDMLKETRQNTGEGPIVHEGYLNKIMPNNDMIGFNLRRAPTNDSRVRQAIAHAIDREYIVEYAVHGFGMPSFGPIPSAIEWAYDPNVEKRYPFNLTRADELLDEAGYPRGSDGVRFSISLVTCTCIFNDGKIAEVLKEQLSKVGIAVTIENLDFALLVDKVMERNEFDVYGFGYGYGLDWQLSGVPVFDPRIGAGARVDPTGYNNSRALELFDLDAAEWNQTIRKEYLREIQEILMDDLPFIPLWQYPYPWVIREGVHGLPENSDPDGSLQWNTWVEWGQESTTGWDNIVLYGSVIAVAIILAVVAIYYVRRKASKKE